MHTARDILAAHGIHYNAGKKNYTTNCPRCRCGYLSVSIKNDAVQWYCHSCQEGGGEGFSKKLGNGSDTFPWPIPWDTPAAVFDYTDESGNLLFQVVRFNRPSGYTSLPEKTFLQRKGPGERKWGIEGIRIVPFRFPELIYDLELGRTIVYVEGEKDVNTLRRHGIPATCGPMGAGKWWPEFASILRGADIVVCGDNDAPGRSHVDLVRRNLENCATARVLDLAKHWPEMRESDDVSDWFEKGGGTPEKFWELVRGCQEDKAKPDNLVLSSAEFFKKLKAPDYLIEGIVQRRYMYSLTGATGTGKTAITLFLMASVCLGRPIGKIEVARGGVIYFAGENPDDILYRWIALTQHFGTSPTEIENAWFVPGVFRFSEIMDKIRDEMAARPIALAIVDTSAAYFEGDDENSNAQLGEHARRMRGLIRMDGAPSIIINAHPGKYAQSDNLLPRGGGAFLAEMDGNLICRKTDSAIELHWQGKFRGPDFAPINFRMETVTHELLKDTRDRLVPTVIAQAISDEAAENITKAMISDEDAVLASIRDDPKMSVRERAAKLQWLVRSGEPNRMKVQRAIEALENDGLVRRNRRTFEITEKGKKVLENVE